jgi:hypothetical protein
MSKYVSAASAISLATEATNDALIKIEKAVDEVLKELTSDYFIKPYWVWITGQSAHHMMTLAKVQFDSPYDFLESLYESLFQEKYPDYSTWNGEEHIDLKKLFRPGAFAVSESVTEKTTWGQFEKSVNEDLETVKEDGPRSSSFLEWAAQQHVTV